MSPHVEMVFKRFVILVFVTAPCLSCSPNCRLIKFLAWWTCSACASRSEPVHESIAWIFYSARRDLHQKPVRCHSVQLGKSAVIKKWLILFLTKQFSCHPHQFCRLFKTPKYSKATHYFFIIKPKQTSCSVTEALAQIKHYHLFCARKRSTTGRQWTDKKQNS